MTDKEFSPKKLIFSIVSGIIVTLAVTLITRQIINSNAGNSQIKPGVMTALKIYEDDLNQNKFDADKYFARDVERYFQMFRTSPAKINDFWNGAFNKTFSGMKIHFDEATLNVISQRDNCYEISIIMYSDYYNLKEEKQHTHERSRFEMKFDNDFRIFSMRQFFD